MGVLSEVLSVERSDDSNDDMSAAALAIIAPLLRPEEALAVARGIDNSGRRAKALAAVVVPFSMMTITDSSLHQWSETVRVLARNTRRECVGDFAAVLPLIEVVGGETAISSLGRSINCVGRWWQSLVQSKVSAFLP
jgi:hypothetical protein